MNATTPSDSVSCLAASAAWNRYAPELAAWTRAHLVNRTGCYGAYCPDGGSITDKGPLTEAVLANHFRGQRIIGLHAIDLDQLCRFVGFDFDQHGNDAKLAQQNLDAAFLLDGRLLEMGLHPLLEHSNGRGSYKIWNWFADPVNARNLRRWAMALVQELPVEVEVFPKQEAINPDPEADGHYGNFLRLPGRHHKRDWWSEFWDGESWQAGEDAVSMYLDWQPSDAVLVPPAPPKTPPPPAPRLDNQINVDEREKRCRAYLAKCPDAISGQHGHDATLRAAAECYRFDLDDAAALRVMADFNTRKTGGEPWSDRELEHKLEDAKAKVMAAGEFGMRLVERPPQAGKPAPAKSKGQQDRAAGDDAPVDARPDYPRPIPLDKLTPPAMPDDIFTAALGDMIRAVSGHTETPRELAACFGMGALSTVCQTRFSLLVESGYFEPLNLWLVAAMESGNRKSATLARMSAPLVTWERDHLATVQQEAEEAESRAKSAQARIAQLRLKAAKTTDDAQRDALEQEIAEAEAGIPKPPTLPRLFADDVTPEHLGTMMAQHGEAMAILSDEGGTFDLMGGRYSNGIPNLDLYLKSHSGVFVRVDRGSRPPVILNHPALTIALSPQPEVLRGLTQHKGFRGRGLLARFLYLLPESRIGSRTLTPQPMPEGTAAAYADDLGALLARRPNDDGTPHVLRLSAAGYSLWKTFQRDVENMMAEGGRLEHLRDWGSKLPGAAGRIAGLFHCAEHARQYPELVEVGDETMGRAVRLAQLLIDHALAVFDLMGAAPAADQARRVWDYIDGHRQNFAEMFNFSDLWHPLRGSFKSSEDIEPAIVVLVERAYLIEQADSGPRGRGRPARRYFVNPRVVEEWQK